MGILDEAIREHLELKRQHGADDSEVQQLEDEAFGQAERPGGEEAADPLAEAPTEFLTQPETGEEPAARREATITDLQEAPEPPPSEEQATPEDEVAPADEGPAVEEHPAMEYEAVTDLPELDPAAGPEPVGPSTEERHVISEQPTELFDVEEELAASGPPNPTDEELVEEELAEPKLAPSDPLAGLEESEELEATVERTADQDVEEDEDEEFWDEKRLSDELDQALEAPPEDEPAPEDEPEPTDEAKPAESEGPHPDEDVLEETPDFLEEAPEDDQLWFEQKPPKDFDFDD